MCIFLEYYFKIFVYDLFMNQCNKTHLNRVLDTLGAKLSEVDRHLRGMWLIEDDTPALSWNNRRLGLCVDASSDGAGPLQDTLDAINSVELPFLMIKLANNNMTV